MLTTCVTRIRENDMDILSGTSLCSGKPVSPNDMQDWPIVASNQDGPIVQTDQRASLPEGVEGVNLEQPPQSLLGDLS